jgi:diketogulonate reductase-like aldo/keto reductase
MRGISSTRIVRGLAVPSIFYGTAWKEDATEQLVNAAIAAGFRGIDTANQRKHYYEAAVGRAVQTALGGAILKRKDLFIQTKFTFVDGQDHRLPYDPKDPIASQVEQSLQSSLAHHGVTSVDSLVLHGPSTSGRLAAADHDAWRAMEQLQKKGQAALLGVSNVSATQLEEFIAFSKLPLAFVQNRCYAARGWDADIRNICAAAGIVYQGFSLLTANKKTVASPAVASIANQHRKTPAQVIFRFALQLGMLPLTGTRNAGHMADDLNVFDFALSEQEKQRILDAER